MLDNDRTTIPTTTSSSTTTTTTTTSNEDADDSDIEKGNQHKKRSLTELDSGLSENELFQNRITDSISSKLNTILPPPTSDVESGFSGDYSPHGKAPLSPFTLQDQSSIDMNDMPTIERIALELNSIALDWRSYHTPLHCACSLPFDSAQRKVRRIYPHVLLNYVVLIM